MQRLGDINESFTKELKQLENQRKKVQKRLNTSLVVGMLLLIVLIFVAGNSSKNIQIFIVAGSILLGASYYFLFLRRTLEEAKTFKTKLRTVIINSIIQKIDPAISFNASKFIGINDFIGSELYDKIPNSYQGGNYFQIPQKNYTVEFSNATALQVRSTQEDSILLFTGLFFVFTLNKHSSTRTLITPDRGMGILEFVTDSIESNKYRNYTRFKIDNEEFEDHFNIFGNSIAEATRLITPEIQETLVKLKKHYDSQILCSFGAEKTYVLIRTHRSYFDLSIDKEADSHEQQKAFFDDLVECIGIIKSMDQVVSKI